MFNLSIQYLIGQGAYALFLLGILRLTRPAYLAFRRRRSGFGVVFNSDTGIPEDLVTVRLRDLHGQIVRTVVSDKHGRYKLLAPKGEYYVEATKAGFAFPSSYLGKPEATVYDNVLPAAHVIIKDYGVMTKNIPIDPVGARRRSSWFPRRVILRKNTQYLLAMLGPVVALVIAYAQQTSWISWTAFSLFMLVLILRLLSFKPAVPPYGTVTDAERRPLSQVVVRLLDARFNKVLETQVTSPKGRYAFIVGTGTYRVLFKKKGYKSVIMNFPNLRKEGVLLAKDVRLKPLTPKQAEEEAQQPDELELPIQQASGHMDLS